MNNAFKPKPQPPATPSKRTYYKQSSPGTPGPLARSLYNESYLEGELLGRGSYSLVKKCREKKTGDYFAIKKIDLQQGTSHMYYHSNFQPDFSRKAGHREVELFEILKDKPHTNIVRCFKHWEENAHLYILLELCDGSLETFQPFSYTQYQLTEIKRQVALALSFLHDLHCPHGDVKPSNILIKQENHGVTYKLADLGTKTGDGNYLAPEMLNTPKPGDRRPADIFALGMSLYRLGYGKGLWTTKQPCVDTSQIKPEEIFLPQSNFTSHFVDLLKKMMSNNPESRPRAVDLLQEEVEAFDFEDYTSQSESLSQPLSQPLSQSLSQPLSSSWSWPANDENPLRRSGSFDRLTLREVTPPRESQRYSSVLKRSAGSPRRTTPPKKLRLSTLLNL